MRRIRALDAAFALTLVIHGPVDAAFTYIALSIETNPAMLQLGLSNWMLLKGAILILAVGVWYDATGRGEYRDAALVWMGTMLGLGIALILPGAFPVTRLLL